MNTRFQFTNLVRRFHSFTILFGQPVRISPKDIEHVGGRKNMLGSKYNRDPLAGPGGRLPISLCPRRLGVQLTVGWARLGLGRSGPQAWLRSYGHLRIQVGVRPPEPRRPARGRRPAEGRLPAAAARPARAAEPLRLARRPHGRSDRPTVRVVGRTVQPLRLLAPSSPQDSLSA